jgi:hypothetical protein
MYLHKNKNPDFGIFECFKQSRPHGDVLSDADGVASHAVVGELTLLGGQPPGLEGLIRQQEASSDCDNEGGNSLDNEEPPPAREAVLAVELEDSESDETGEGGCENIAGVEDADSGGNLFAGVEDAWHWMSTLSKTNGVRTHTE